ncbi:MAG: hypothetical protein FWC39_05555 [Bacteroidetes bacterium]|nr:hypothetical protein [Bacteroidota bacterium]
MEKKEIIKQFVLNKDMGNGRESCLVKALEDARRLYTNEDLWKRIDNLSDYSNQEEMIELAKRVEIPFLSLIGYLILLDLIGNVFTQKENIIKAIETFGSPKLKECKHQVNALRNSLAHNYGLINIPNNSKYDEQSLHKFTLLEKENSEKIFDRKQQWERGKWKDKNEDTSTIVYVKNLVNEIEKLIKNLQEDAENDKLSIYLDGGIEELRARFTIEKK